MTNSLEQLLDVVARTGYAFVPPTPETHRRVNARPGNERAHDLRGVFGWNRPFDAQLIGPQIHRLLREADAIEDIGGLCKSRVRIATLNGRHYLHSAFPTIEPDSVFFGPDTYRFVRAALAALPHHAFARAVDIGCGSGAGGLEVAAARKIGALWLTDINPAALALARINTSCCATSDIGRPVAFAISDLFAALDGDFDLILANPPYLADPARRTYRDGGGPLGMALGLRIVREGVERLTPGGTLFLYTGVPIEGGVDHFCAAMEQTLPAGRFALNYSEIDPDVFGEELELPAYSRVDRIAAIALMITRLRT